MKIRIKGNSIRFRLTRPEVERLDIGADIQESTEFVNNSLAYRITCTEDQAIGISFEENRISLFLPISMLSSWKVTDQVGFRTELDRLVILVEKDFTCLDNVEEDQSENYPNPLLNSKK